MSAIATSDKQPAIELRGWSESALDDAGSGSDPVARDVGYGLSPAPNAKSLSSPAANGYPTGKCLGAGRSTIHKIFEKFVRTSSSLTTPLRGSGLGLFICRCYIESMGGKLWLERSVPGEGSVFSFYLRRIEMPIEVSEQDESDSEF